MYKVVCWVCRFFSSISCLQYPITLKKVGELYQTHSKEYFKVLPVIYDRDIFSFIRLI